MSVIIWVAALVILYAAAKGLDRVNRATVKPRTYQYGE